MLCAAYHAKKFGIEKLWVAECKPLKLTNKCHCLVDRNLRMTGIIILQSIYDDAYGCCALNCGQSPSQRASMRFLVWSEFERLAGLECDEITRYRIIAVQIVWRWTVPPQRSPEYRENRIRGNRIIEM